MDKHTEAHSERLTESFVYPGNPRSPRRSHFQFPTLSTPSHCPIWSDSFIHQTGWQFVSNKQNGLLNNGHYKQRLSFHLSFLFQLHPINVEYQSRAYKSVSDRVLNQFLNVLFKHNTHTGKCTKDTDQLIFTQ